MVVYIVYGDIIIMVETFITQPLVHERGDSSNVNVESLKGRIKQIVRNTPGFLCYNGKMVTLLLGDEIYMVVIYMTLTMVQK